MFCCLYHPQVAKDLKQIEPQAQAEILQRAIHQIVSNPHQGTRLHGSLRDFYKYKCSFAGTSYRIIYQIQNSSQIVLILLIASRAGVYERLLRRLH